MRHLCAQNCVRISDYHCSPRLARNAAEEGPEGGAGQEGGQEGGGGQPGVQGEVIGVLGCANQAKGSRKLGHTLFNSEGK